jgi:hypothetical protein
MAYVNVWRRGSQEIVACQVNPESREEMIAWLGERYIGETEPILDSDNNPLPTSPIVALTIGEVPIPDTNYVVNRGEGWTQMTQRMLHATYVNFGPLEPAPVPTPEEPADQEPAP